MVIHKKNLYSCFTQKHNLGNSLHNTTKTKTITKSIRRRTTKIFCWSFQHNISIKYIANTQSPLNYLTKNFTIIKERENYKKKNHILVAKFSIYHLFHTIVEGHNLLQSVHAKQFCSEVS